MSVCTCIHSCSHSQPRKVAQLITSRDEARQNMKEASAMYELAVQELAKEAGNLDPTIMYAVPGGVLHRTNNGWRISRIQKE